MKPAQSTKVSVVIPNLNGAEVIGSCLSSLMTQTHQPAEIIVVDNGSNDDSVVLIERQFPDVKLVKLTTNTGFAGGVNRGIERADGDYVVLFNNDAVADQQMIEQLLATAKRSGAMIVAASLLTADGKKIDTVGEMVSTWGLPGSTLRGEPAQARPTKDQAITAACAGAALYRRALFDQIGLFDETYFAYYEDVDISLRARMAGEQVYLSAKATAYHKISFTQRKMPGFGRRQSIRNGLILDLKFFPAQTLLKNCFKIAFVQFRIQMAAIVHGYFLVPLQADLGFLRVLSRVWQARKQLQQTSQLSRAEFEQLLTDKFPLKFGD